MAIESDVLVIGGGLAGAMAAIAAAEAGADARLVTANQSTLRQASGLIDVLGYPPESAALAATGSGPGGDGDAGGGDDALPDEEGGTPTHGQAQGGADDEVPVEGTVAEGGPLVDPFDALSSVPEGHPYERVGVDAVRDGLACFDAVVAGYAGDHTDANALVPTHGGTVKPTARYPESVAAGLASDGRDAVLVGFETLSGFDAPMTAAHLRAAGVPFDVEGVTVEFPGDLRADATVNRYAELLDADEPPAEDRQSAATRDGSVRAELAARTRDAIAAADVEPERVGFPAVLGEEVPAEVRADLGADLGLPVFEVPTGPPSVPGLRLEGRLHDALAARDVRVADGRPVVDYEASDGTDTGSGDGTGGGDAGDGSSRRIDHVLVRHADQGTVPYAADQYVLATGGLVGRGIDSDREAVSEPVFDCHVPHPDDRYDWFEPAPFDDHPFARFGVGVDRDLRPQTADGAPEFANLRAAGAVLGGYDFAAEKSGSGVSIATGFAAGTAAAEGV